MKSLIYKLKEKKGAADLIMALGGTLILFAILAIAMAVYPAFVLRSSLQDTATETVRYMELRGTMDDSIQSEFQRLCDIYGIEDANISVEGEYMPDGSRLQLQSAFTVTVKANYQSSFFTVPLTARATGRSEVYWKN